MTKDAICQLIVGRRKTGKSVRARHMVKASKRLIVVDPIGDWRDGLPEAASYDDLVSRVRRGWRRGFRLCWSPTGGNEVAEVDRLAGFLMRAQEGYLKGRHRVKITLVVDELNLSFPPGLNASKFGGLLKLCLQGRHYGIEMIGITQRPTSVRADWRSNSEFRYLFPVSDHVDLDNLRKQIGPAAVETLVGLPEYHCLLVRDGSVEVLKPVKVAGRKK